MSLVKHTQIKARQPKLSGGCKSMHRLKQNSHETLEDSVRMTLNVLNNPKKVANVSLTEHQ